MHITEEFLREAIQEVRNVMGFDTGSHTDHQIMGLWVTCHGIFPPSAIRVRPMERTDDEEGTTD